MEYSKEQIKGFLKRKSREEEKLSYVIIPKKRGQPSKKNEITEKDKLADLRYKLACKEARIKQIEMENELMRDFLSLTGRK